MMRKGNKIRKIESLKSICDRIAVSCFVSTNGSQLVDQVEADQLLIFTVFIFVGLVLDLSRTNMGDM